MYLLLILLITIFTSSVFSPPLHMKARVPRGVRLRHLLAIRSRALLEQDVVATSAE